MIYGDERRLQYKWSMPVFGLDLGGNGGGGLGLANKALTDEITLPSYTGQVVTRSIASNSATTGVTSYNKPTAHVVRQGGLTSVTVSYASIYVRAEQPPVPSAGHGTEIAASALSGTVSIEQPLGTVLGSGGLSVPAGSEASVEIFLSSSPVDGSIIWIRYNITAPGGSIPYMSAGGGDSAWTAIGESINALYPCKVEGVTTKPTFVIYGNSINAGNGDVPDTLGNVGEFSRSIGALYAYRNIGIPTDELYWFARNHRWRLGLASSATHVCFNGDINGTRAVRGNWSGEQCLADAANVCKLFPGKVLIFGTSAPAPTDAATPDVNDAQRLSYNSGIRAKPAPIAAVIDSAHLFDANDDGLWDDLSDQSGDWVHPSPTGYGRHANIVPARDLAKLAPMPQNWSRWALLANGSNQGVMLDANDATCFGRKNIADDATPVFWANKCNFGAYDKSSGSSRPALISNVNGSRSALRFNANASQDLIASSTPRRLLNGASGFLIVALVSVGANGTASRYIYYLSTETDPALNRLGLQITTTGLARCIVRRGNGTTSTVITGSTALNAVGPSIISAFADVAGSVRTLNLRVNGNTDATVVNITDVAAPFSSTDSAASTIGSSNSIADSFFDGDIFSVDVLPGIFTLDQVQRAEGDVAWENGLASILPVSHPYKLIRPT